MATARWNRRDCSICLEPFRGRNPKFLPCYHTFCVQCLNQLADRAREEPRTQRRRNGNIRITCPSCRKTTPVPPEGIESLQTNFYIDDTTYCDLCDEGHTAELACSTCPSKFCRGCQSVHQEICELAAVYEISDSTAGSVDLATKVNIVSAKLQRLEKLTELTPMLARDLNAAQEKSIKMRNDQSSLQSEQASLKSLISNLDSRHQDLCLMLEAVSMDHQDSANTQQKNVDDLCKKCRLLRSDFDKHKAELEQSLHNVRLRLQNLQSKDEDIEIRLAHHSHNGLERRHDALRKDHDKLQDRLEEHVGPKYDFTITPVLNRYRDASDHAKLEERIRVLESNMNKKLEANETNHQCLETNMKNKIEAIETNHQCLETNMNKKLEANETNHQCLETNMKNKIEAIDSAIELKRRCLESNMNIKMKCYERNRQRLEGNMNEKIASNWNSSVKLIIGLLILASVVNCIVLAIYHDKFVRLR